MLTGCEKLQNLITQKRPIWMGIINLTPDSFSDGGRFNSTLTALQRAEELCNAGAEILDLGGISTRPGSTSISPDEELERVLPILQVIKSQFGKHVLLSIDTFEPKVAFELAKLGLIDIINDIYAGTITNSFNNTFQIAADFKLGLIIMHMQGTPQTMQIAPAYTNPAEEIAQFLSKKASIAQTQGVKTIILDPGIGFGKTTPHNLAILCEKGLKNLTTLGYPVLIGLSRKKFLGELSSENIPARRDIITKEWEANCIKWGATIIRSHKMPSEVEDSLD